MALSEMNRDVATPNTEDSAGSSETSNALGKPSPASTLFAIALITTAALVAGLVVFAALSNP